MVRVIYGDVLLLIDFCMNFFVLYTTSIVLHRRVKSLCLVGAAVIGGIYSVAKVFIGGNDVIDCILSLCIGVLMCYVSFGGYSFFKTIVVFFCISALVGGIMFAAYFLLGSYHADIYGNAYEYAYSHMPLWMFIVLAAASMLISWMFSYIGRDSIEKTEESVFVEYCGKNTKLSLLLDSGNLAKEPISGKNVVMVGKWKAKALLDDETFSEIMNKNTESLLKKKFRLICATGIDGQKRIYYGFLPEKLYVIKGNNKVEYDAYIAICDTEMFFGDCDGLAHPSVVM